MANEILERKPNSKKCPVCRSERYQFAPGLQARFLGDYVTCSNCNVVYLRRDE